jgi:hypothetical protein
MRLDQAVAQMREMKLAPPTTSRCLTNIPMPALRNVPIAMNESVTCGCHVQLSLARWRKSLQCKD